MREELKLIRTGNDPNAVRVYMYNGRYINVDTFNNILDGWYYSGCDVKKYTMEHRDQFITVWYIK